MIRRTLSLATVLTVIGCGSAQAQQAAEKELVMLEQVEALEAQNVQNMQRSAKNEQKLREAEAKLQAAAKEVAELSRGLASRSFSTMSSHTISHSGPRLGVALATRVVNGAADGKGVQVMSVSPGSAAADAGILAGDRIIEVAKTSLSDSDATAASEEIGKLLKDKKVGDSIPLRVLRDGKDRALNVVLNEQSFSAPPNRFSMIFDGRAPRDMPNLGREMTILEHDIEGMDFERIGGGQNQFHFLRAGSAWSSMQLVELSPGLGDYFGTEKGLLVVTAPTEGELGFEDGDVILKIGTREPNDVDHAMRILRSYASGEALEVQILRKKRKRTLNITVPESVGDASRTLFEWKDDDNAEIIFIDERTPSDP